MKRLVLVLSFVGLIFACSGDGGGNSTGDNYNRTEMLTNWADNIIVPAYENYHSKVGSMKNSGSAFISNPTVENLQILRQSWYEAYLAYQWVGMYAFGKADENSFKEATNTFPADVGGITTNITSGTYNLSQFLQFSRQGFPGLDYLINGLGNNDAEIVAFYSTNPNSLKYKRYLTDVIDKMDLNISAIVTDWNSGYRDAYIQNSGTSINSSVNKTVNNFVKYLEKDIRSGKVGIPAGKFSNGVKYPEKVEGLYKNDVSNQLLAEALKASQQFFNGQKFSSTTSGLSLHSYLDHVNAIRNDQPLKTIINNQFAAILSVQSGLNNNFSQQIVSDNSRMIALYDAIQQNVIYTKLDMMQALNITIDYVDGDGD